MMMEVCCSFKAITGGVCGFDGRDRKKEVQVVPLSSCSKDIANHLESYSFTGPENEIDLILCRAAVFKIPDSFERMTICPRHRGKLGVGWTRGATRCRIPTALSNHGKGHCKTWPQGDRGIGKQDSEMVLRKTGVFIQAGSGKVVIQTMVYNLLFTVSLCIIKASFYSYSVTCVALPGICRSCRDKMTLYTPTSPTTEVDELEVQLKTTTLHVCYAPNIYC